MTTNRTMRAAMFHGPKNVVLEETAIPKISDDEVLVKIKATTTCGTDRKLYLRSGKKYPAYFKPPTIFGHEIAGEIYQLGKNVTDYEIGQPVYVHDSGPCLKCFYCKIGRHSLCENITWNWGTWTDFLKVPKEIVHCRNMVPFDTKDLSFAEAALTEPLSCVLMGVERSNIGLGDTVVINGAGPIGLFWTSLVKNKGAKIIQVDLKNERLELAKKVGADVVLNANEEKDIIQAVKDHTDERRGADIAVEAVGYPETWETTIKMARKGGLVNFFGGPPPTSDISVNTALLHYNELTLIGVFHTTPRYVHASINLLANRKINTDIFITETLKLDELDKILDNLVEQKGIKTAIIP
ncbi:MAG: zinc-binding dehydrogenase [Candidatus Helarchaeota archaeon]|nr:zinc-binding dehydrogenase [Candidatus Helarchaeota archaeon]